LNAALSTAPSLKGVINAGYDPRKRASPVIILFSIKKIAFWLRAEHRLSPNFVQDFLHIRLHIALALANGGNDDKTENVQLF
jgi:hypothetical protein